MPIENIFWDLDECLIHTGFGDPEQKHINFTLEGSQINYYTILRPCALELIEFSRKLVGHENVYILTTAIEEYANKINELAGWVLKRIIFFLGKICKGIGIQLHMVVAQLHHVLLLM